MRPDTEKMAKITAQRKAEQAVQASIPQREQTKQEINGATSVPELRQQVADIFDLLNNTIDTTGIDNAG